MYSRDRRDPASKGMKNANEMLVLFDEEVSGRQGRPGQDLRWPFRQEGERRDVKLAFPGRGHGAKAKRERDPGSSIVSREARSP